MIKRSAVVRKFVELQTEYSTGEFNGNELSCTISASVGNRRLMLGKTRFAGLVCRSRRFSTDGGLGGMERMASPPVPLSWRKQLCLMRSEVVAPGEGVSEAQ